MPRRHTSFATAVMLAALSLPAQALVDIPASVQQTAPQLRLLGSGKMTWFGLHLYDVALWTPAQAFDFDNAFALAIRYTRGFKGDRIAQRSALEIERLGVADAAQLRRWQQQMVRLFPDVRPGDRLTGVYQPGRGAEFFYQDRSIGHVADPHFARAFFSIWLDPRTLEPDLREQLIGIR